MQTTRRSFPVSGSRGEKLYDHFGTPLAEVRARDDAWVEEREARLAKVAAMVPAVRELLLPATFVLVSANTFLVTDGLAVVLPAELAAVRFSLQGGVGEHDVYQVFPEPGQVPLGWASAVREASEGGRAAGGHRVPFPGITREPDLLGEEPVEFVTQTPTATCTSLLEFLGTSRHLFCPEGEMEEVGAVLANLFARAGRGAPPATLLPLHALVHHLAPRAVPSLAKAEVELDKKRFDGLLELACRWHGAWTDTGRCSAATARRQAHALLDMACGEHGVEVVAGRHVPAVEARPLLALDWGEEEVREVAAPKAPPLRSYFGEVGGRARPFPATDLRRRRAAPPPVQEWEEWGGYSAGTISEFLGANRSDVDGLSQVLGSQMSVTEEDRATEVEDLATGEEEDQGSL